MPASTYRRQTFQSLLLVEHWDVLCLPAYHTEATEEKQDSQALSVGVSNVRPSRPRAWREVLRPPEPLSLGGSHCCPPRALLSSLRNVLSVNTKPPARWHLPTGSSAEPAVLCKLHLQNRELHLTPTAWSHHNQGSVYGRQAPSRLICAPSPSFYKHSAAGVL